MTKIFKKIFSVYNEDYNKIINVIGIKLPIKNKKKFEQWKKEQELLNIKNSYCQKVYSQDGEDIVLKSFIEENLGTDYKGFYVDIGALHPFRFSNTQLFYDKGWKGINIDATPNSMNEFDKYRVNDKNIEALISTEEKTFTYYVFDEPALNCFDKNRAEECLKYGYKIKEEVQLTSQHINTILDNYVPKGQQIDFINIDIEGIDYEVICALNYEKYAPKYFIIENLDYTNRDFMGYTEAKEYKFLSQKGYKVLGKTMRSVIYGK